MFNFFVFAVLPRAQCAFIYRAARDIIVNLHGQAQFNGLEESFSAKINAGYYSENLSRPQAFAYLVCDELYRELRAQAKARGLEGHGRLDRGRARQVVGDIISASKAA